MQIISVINQKGGVGKTTTVINLAAGLSQLNKKILVIDLDPQGNATTGLGLSNTDNSSDTIYGVLNGTKEIYQAIKKTQFENLDLITSNVDLSGLEVETANDTNRAFILKRKLAAYLNDSRGNYDYILIDCPPSLNLLTLNGLRAAKGLLVPMQCEYFALEGLAGLLETVAQLNSSTGHNLQLSAVVRTMFDPRNKLGQQVTGELQKHFSGELYSTVIPRNIKLAEAPSFGQSALSYEPNAKGALAYLALAGELIGKMEDKFIKNSHEQRQA